MGNICPCLKKQKQTTYSYDVHQQTFQMDDNIHNIGQVSPKQNMQNQQNNILTDQLRNSDENIQTGTLKNQVVSEQQTQYSQKHLSLKNNVQNKINHEEINQNKIVQQPIVQPQVSQPVQKPFSANILKGKNTIKKKVNIQDYRFKDQVNTFKVKKIDSIKMQQFNIDNCKGCSYFIFDVTANVYIDDTQDCFIFIAPCESTIFVRSCKNITLVVATKQFRTYNCHNSTFSLYCKSQPVIQSSSNLIFSSFNCPYYQQLTNQFKKVKLQPLNNHWSQIHNFTKKEGEVHFKLVRNIDLTHIQWNKAFSEAQISVSQLSLTIPFINGQLEYSPSKQILVILHQQTTEQQMINSIKGSVILRAFQGIVPGYGKSIKKALLIDPTQIISQQLLNIGKIYTQPEQVKQLKQKWFIKFSDQREK